MKKYAMIAVFAAMCIGVAGCSDTDTESSVELTEILEDEETGTEDAGAENSSEEAAENNSEEAAENSSEETAEENSEDAYVGTYFCEDTATNLTVTTSEDEGYDYTFTWGDGVDWETTYDAVIDGDALTITITMKSDVVLTITQEGNGLTITGDDAYNSEVVQNQRLDGVFIKEEQ